jgi:hypothetical protein
MSEHHVIFLGAGSSYGSGYPLANDLRLLISSRKNWEEALVKYEDEHKLPGKPISALGINYWDYHVVALDLFRNGGFATVDEFCKLAGGFSFQSEINNLRCLLRAALGLFNPEEKFEKSEYYGFIQSLFMPDLLSLRDGVTVLSFNYDPYLEYLLLRALQHRYQVTRRTSSLVLSNEESAAQKKYENSCYAVTSGFIAPADQKWLGAQSDAPTFCVLKLHGSIVSAVNAISDFETLFSDREGSALRRAEKLLGENSGRNMPPILFPWEIMDKNGFIEKDASPFQNAPAVHSLFRSIWERARRAVQTADKISFVGLSMHEYLNDGFRYLFGNFGKESDPKIRAMIDAGNIDENKPKEVQVVVANPENENFKHTDKGMHPASLCGKVNVMLRTVADNMKFVRSSSEDVGGFHGGPEDVTEFGITPRNSFKEFIEREMD